MHTIIIESTFVLQAHCFDNLFRIYYRKPDQVVSWKLCMNTLHWNVPEAAPLALPPASTPPPTSSNLTPKNVSISNTSYLSDSTHCLSQSSVCVLMMWTWCHVFTGTSPLWCDIIVVIFPSHTATLPTVLTDIVELYTVPLLSCTDSMSFCSQIYTELCHYTIQVQSDYSCNI